MKTTALAFSLSLFVSAAGAQQLEVDFTIIEDAQAAGCAGSIVSGLDPNGDGFLSVRAGPGSSYTKLDELYNGDMVRTCAGSGQWVGIYYGQPRRKGWVHGNWLMEGAG